MKNFDLDRLTACFAYVFAVLASAVHLQAHGQTEGAQAAPGPVAPAGTAELRVQYEQWRQEFNTWGRWGLGDNKGASNLITPEKVRSATGLVQNGLVVSLAPPVPQVATEPAGDLLVHRVESNSPNIVINLWDRTLGYGVIWAYCGGELHGSNHCSRAETLIGGK